VRKLTDKVPVPGQMLREPVTSGECRLSDLSTPPGEAQNHLAYRPHSPGKLNFSVFRSPRCYPATKYIKAPFLRGAGGGRGPTAGERAGGMMQLSRVDLSGSAPARDGMSLSGSHRLDDAAVVLVGVPGQ